jgi:DNA-binding transcriptional ArsR family regulator
MRTKGEIEALIGTLRHPEACSEAQKALIEIGAPAVPLLINALRDRDISLAAAGVLREIGTVAVEPLIAALGNENKRVSAYAAIVLEDIGLPSVEPLITALTSKDRRTRILTVRALGHIGDDRAVGPLTGVFNEATLSDKEGTLLAATIESLRKLGKIVEKPEETLLQRGRTRQRSRKSQKLLLEFVKELRNKGFEVSPRSGRLYYHPHIPDIRFAICQRVVRIERRKRRNDRWQLVRSFSIARETHLALEAIDAILTVSPSTSPASKILTGRP